MHEASVNDNMLANGVTIINMRLRTGANCEEFAMGWVHRETLS